MQKFFGMWNPLNIRDDRVPQAENVDRHHKILRNWPKVIQDDFENQMMSRRLLRKSTGSDEIIDVLCGEVRKLVEKNGQIKQGMDELASAVNNINNSARLMEENALLKYQAKKNEYRNNLEIVLDQMSPNPPSQTLKVDADLKDSVRGQLQERFQAKEDWGESVQFTRRVVQDLTHVDIIQASNRAQEWEEEQRVLILFKRKLIETVYILLCAGEFGPVPIRTNNGIVISLTTENLHVLANIVDPMCGYELSSRRLNRATNDKSFSKHLRPTAMFVT